INQGVDRGKKEEQGAGDQGMMFGYATRETDNYMPLALDISHKIMQVLADYRREGKQIPYLRPDAKAQVTIEYSDENVPQRIDTIVVSTQHDEFAPDGEMLAKIKADIKEIVMPEVKRLLPENIHGLFTDSIIHHVNSTGKVVSSGHDGDSGMPDRKIFVDTDGGKGAHGRGVFSGKVPSKVARAADYAAAHGDNNLLAAGVTGERLKQLS